MIAFIAKLRRPAALFLLLVILGFALWSSLQETFAARQQASSASESEGVIVDGAAVWASRLNPLVSQLPPQGNIGYISERDIPGQAFDAGDQDEEFAMTQYVIAPRILIQNRLDSPVMIVNLPYLSEPQVQELLQAHGYKPHNSFGNGIYLFQKVSP